MMDPLAARPLLSTARDEVLFVGRRRELDLLVGGVARGFNLLVSGPRGSGKTSLLRALEARLGKEGRRSVFVDAGAAVEVGDLLRLLRWRLGRAPVPADVARASLPPSLRPEAAEVLLDLLASLREEPPTVVLLDALPSGGLGHALFGRLRDELWQLPLTWVVAVDEGDRGALLRPPADAFFESVIALEPLAEADAAALVRRRAPADLPEAVVQAVVDLGRGNPRLLVSLLREAVVEGRTPEEMAEARADAERRVAALGPAAVRLAAELEALGPASASDEELLGRLGWTRARAAQVLKALEAEGLVEGSLQANGPGRPRKLYRLVRRAAR